MAKIRKINVSEIVGINPPSNGDAVMPAGTIVVYEINNNGSIDYVLRIHDGVTDGGVPFPNAPSIEHNNDINITVDSGDSSSYTWNFGQTGTLTAPGTAIFNGTDGIVVDDLNEGIAALFNNGDVYITGGESIRFTGINEVDGFDVAVLRFWNNEGRHSSGNDPTELVTLNVGNDADFESPTEGFFKIVTEKQVGGEKAWKFDANGALTFPDGSVQTTAYTSAGSLYVIVNNSGEISTSSDGQTWTAGTDTGIDFVQRVAVGTSAIVYIGEVEIPDEQTSEDAIFYQTRVDGVINRVTQFELGAYNFREVVWGGGRFVLVGHTLDPEAPDQPVLFTSTNGQTWTATDIDPTYVSELGANEFEDVYYDGTGFLITATGGIQNQAGGFYVTDPTGPLGQNDFVLFVLAGDGEPVYVEFEELAYGGSGWIARAENDILHSFTGEFSPGESPAEWTPLDVATPFKEFCGLNLEDGGENSIDIIELEGGVIGDTHWIIFTTSNGHVGATSDLGANWTFSIPQPYTNSITFVTIDEGGITTIALESNNLLPGEKITISNSGIEDLDGTYYVDNPGDSTNANILYTDSALTTPKISAQGGTPNEGNLVTRGAGMYLDAASILNGYMYVANDDEQIFRSTNGETWTKVDDQGNTFSHWNDIDYNPAFGGVILGSVSTGDITFSGVNIIGTAAAERFGLINLVPALSADDGFNNINFLESGQFISIYPTNAFDEPHIHIAAGLGLEDAEGDLFLGDDNKYVSVNSGGNIRIQSFNSETNIGHQWNFGTDGKLTLPGNIATLEIDEANPDGGLVVSVDTGTGTESKSLYKFGRGGQFTSRAISVTDANGDRVGGLTGDGFGPILNAPADKEVWISTDGQHLWRFTADRDFVLPYGGGNIRSEGNINIDINLSDSTMRRWSFGEDGDLTFPDNTTQTTAFVQGEQIFTVDYGNTDYAPTVVDFNLLLVIPAGGYSDVTPTSVTLPNGVPGQRLVIFNGYNLATLTVNPGFLGRDISGGVVAEFICSSDGWIPLYGTNSPT